MKLITTICVIFAFSFYNEGLAEINPDSSTGLKIDPEKLRELRKSPKVLIAVSSKGDFSIDKVIFTKEQLSVIFRNIHAINPSATIEIQRAKDTPLKYVVTLFELARDEGIDQAVITKIPADKK